MHGSATTAAQVGRPDPRRSGLARRQRRVADWLRRTPDRRAAVLKRGVDVVLGTLLTLLTLPVVVLLAAGAGVSLRAWPLFTQTRPGRDGRPFRIVKVRTLSPALPAYGHKDDLVGELRATPPFCRLLRRTHLDELPQLALVVSGRMTLVGPRPSQPLQYEHLDDTFESMRTAVRPGCTGLWQIGAAHDLALDADPEYDTFYLEHAGLRLDLWILARTMLFMVGVVGPVRTDDVPRRLLNPRGPGVAAAPVPPAPAVREQAPGQAR